jgi:GNAT superfamily N-acetyltransferase
MKIITVQTKKEWKQFHQVPFRVYKNNPYWVCPLQSDVKKIFDPSFNKYLKDGEAQAFVLLDDNNKPAGRVATFIDHKRNREQGTAAGGIGYFECIDNKDMAAALLQHAENHLSSKGVNTIDGPINLGERDKFWGLLVKGYDEPPYFQENYHPEYYKAFFEDNGYRPYEQVLTLTTTMDTVPIERLSKVAARARERHPFRVEELDFKKVEKYAEDSAEVYNEAFKHSPYFQPLKGQQVMLMFESIKALLDPKMVVFAYFDDNPVAFCAFLPDLNPYLKGLKGKLNWWRLPIFLFRLKTARVKNVKGVAFGIHPEYQGKGVFPIIADHMHNDHNKKYYDKAIMATIRGHNTRMVKTCMQLGTKIDRVHVTYRKILDDRIPFEPFEFYPV